jgi:hypothetical protein
MMTDDEIAESYGSFLMRITRTLPVTSADGA